ncbi:MAG: PTS glucose transporter subunit IIA [Breznakia sp.]
MFTFFKKKKIELYSPIHGVVLPIEEVPDPVFSKKMMGEGIAIEYLKGDVYAPFDGVISSILLPSAHAFGITSEQGIEILVHIGLETVNLKAGVFKPLKKQGDRVKQGEKILQIDEASLKNNQSVLISPVVVLKADNYKLNIVREKGQIISEKDVLLSFE